MFNEKRLTRCIGAEIDGVDLSLPIDKDLSALLRDSLARNQVIFFRDQHLTFAQQKALTASFGAILRVPYVEPLDGEPDIIRVFKAADEPGGVFGGGWHTDFSFLERPPAGSVLSAEETPPFGGDTLWVSQATAWDGLPDPLKGLLLGRDAIHVGKPYGVKWSPPVEERAGASMNLTRGDPGADEERRHPAVLRHPVTQRLMLFLNPTYVCRLEGMTEDESRPVLEAVQAHATRPEFCCRFHWTPGTVAVWDNLSTQHYAVNDYSGFDRLMYRTTFAGPTPREIAAEPDVVPGETEAA